MMQIIVVEKLDTNPLVVLDRATVDDALVGGETRRLVENYNKRSIMPAEGALAWSVSGGAKKFEYRVGAEGLVEYERGETANVHGTYVCASGARYKFYGKAVSYVPGRESLCEIFVFHPDKQFKHDGFLDSKDCLAKLRGLLIDMRCDREATRRLGIQVAEMEIEKWDANKRASRARN